ncbi:DUF4255 domain-containing protein [Aliikangiella sp. IMCC44359]|uniref:DUF4255 domain-containing protein n=1 Tax=Aliikangiella sp. IMCC44359 TaxID=3459125 RepID=UPI00403AE042
MSNPDAIATVTATLHHLLTNAVPTASITTKPPSTARTSSSTAAQINLFLYATHYNSAFSNLPIPHQSKSGENAFPPLPLVLKYLITAYGSNDDDISGQQLMGQAMSFLHNHPLLGESDIVGITPDSGLQSQIEKVRITPDSLSLDDMSKLWSSFQSAEYRLSTGYEVSVVLIDSTRQTRTPLPVLKRGADGLGPEVIVGSPASLTGLSFVNNKPTAELEDLVTLTGSHLTSEDSVIRFEHAKLDDNIEVQPVNTLSKTELSVQLPTLVDDPNLGFNWPAGFYTILLVTQRAGLPAMKSNSISLQLAPQIESISPTNASAGEVAFTIECMPQIKAGQSVVLLFGDQMISADSIVTPADPTAVTTLTFTVSTTARVAPYVLRLRVDGVDSIPIDFSGSTPAFAADQQVTIS